MRRHIPRGHWVIYRPTGNHLRNPGVECSEPIGDDPGPSSRGGTDVDGSHFDTWTRRTFGLAAGGAALSGLLGLAGLDEAQARRNRRRRNKKKQQCRKIGQSCNEATKGQQCCKSGQLCANVSGLGSGNFCCKQAGSSCTTSTECCGNNACDAATSQCRVTR